MKQIILSCGDAEANMARIHFFLDPDGDLMVGTSKYDSAACALTYEGADGERVVSSEAAQVLADVLGIAVDS